MKLMNKITVALIALFCMSNLGAFTWNFENKTNKTLVIKFGLKAHPHWYYNIVTPKNTAKFNFDGSLARHCMHSFQWAEYDPNMKVTKEQSQGQIETQNGGLNLYQPGWTLIGPEFGHVPYQYKDTKVALVVTTELGQTTHMLYSEDLAAKECSGRNFVISEDRGNIVFTATKN